MAKSPSDVAAQIKLLADQAKSARASGDRDNELKALFAINGIDASGDPHWKVKLGRSLIVHELYDDAATILRELGEKETGGSSYKLLSTEYLASLEKTDQLKANFEKWITEPYSPAELIPIAEAAWTFTGDPELFNKLREICIASGPDFTAVAVGAMFHILNPATSMPGQMKVNFALSQLKHLTTVAEALIDQGRIGAARGFIATVLRTMSGNDNVRSQIFRHLKELSRLSNAWVDQTDLPRRIIDEDFTKDVIISEPGEPGKLAVIFTGWNGRPLVGSRILDNQLAKLGYQTILLRDANSVGYGLGIRSLGQDRTSTLRAIEKLIENTGVSDPVFIGTSIGTFGAVSHGLPLGINKFALFGPVTAAGNRSFLHQIGDYRGGVLLNRASRNIPEEEQLMSQFISRASHTFDMRVIVAEGHALDKKYAESISSYDGVDVREVKNYHEHNTLKPTIIRGQLSEHVKFE